MVELATGRIEQTQVLPNLLMCNSQDLFFTLDCSHKEM